MTNQYYGFRIRFYFGLILIIAACVIGFSASKNQTLKSMKMEKLFPSVQVMTIKNQPKNYRYLKRPRHRSR